MANVSRYDPFNELVDDLFKGFFVRPVAFDGRGVMAGEAPRISVEVVERNGAYVVLAELPGAKRDQIDVAIDGTQVTLSTERQREREASSEERVLYTERSYGKASRSFTLPQEIDEAKAEAKYRDGVLELTLPKKSVAARRQIAIQ